MFVAGFFFLVPPAEEMFLPRSIHNQQINHTNKVMVYVYDFSSVSLACGKFSIFYEK